MSLTNILQEQGYQGDTAAELHKRLSEKPEPAPQSKAFHEIERPAHYCQSAIEPIEVIEAWGLGFCLGNVVKYIARAEHKGSKLDDLEKAAWYLRRAIQQAKQK